MKLQVSCMMHFQVTEETTLVLMLRPYRGKIGQWLNYESYHIKPCLLITDNLDQFGNSYQSLLAPVGDFYINTSAEVVVYANKPASNENNFVEIQHLPSEVHCFLLPSRYCESDRFGDIAREVTADAVPGYDQVCAISQWVADTIQYIPGSSAFPLSAVEVHYRGNGVCRDLAQLAIALCRSISIPARFVVGYLHDLQPMDFHAWFEAYVDNRWISFDPTQTRVNHNRVIVAVGRDAADVAIFHQFGSGCQMINMNVGINLLDDASCQFD